MATYSSYEDWRIYKEDKVMEKVGDEVWNGYQNLITKFPMMKESNMNKIIEAMFEIWREEYEDSPAWDE